VVDGLVGVRRVFSHLPVVDRFFRIFDQFLSSRLDLDPCVPVDVKTRVSSMLVIFPELFLLMEQPRFSNISYQSHYSASPLSSVPFYVFRVPLCDYSS